MKEEFPMFRVARIKSNSGIYHLMTRGINQQNIFSSFTEFINFHKQPNDGQCLNTTTKRDTLSDKTIIQLVSQKYNTELAETQKKILQYLKGLDGQLTGLTVNQMMRA